MVESLLVLFWFVCWANKPLFFFCVRFLPYPGKECSQHFLGFLAKAELHRPAQEQTGSSASWTLNGQTQVLVGVNETGEIQGDHGRLGLEPNFILQIGTKEQTNPVADLPSGRRCLWFKPGLETRLTLKENKRCSPCQFDSMVDETFRKARDKVEGDVMHHSTPLTCR